MARGSRARRMIGHSSPPGMTLTERHRELLDTTMRTYLGLKEEGWGPTDHQLAGARHAVRAYATVVALDESGFYPDKTTSIKKAEGMSLARLKGRVEKHHCGGLILVNGMCNKGHDPTRVY